MSTPDPLGDRPAAWPVHGSDDVYRGSAPFALRADRVSRPGHEDDAFTRLVLEHPGAVVVLAVDEQRRAVCLRQYRHPAQREMVELPAGLCDAPGEDPREVAERELREETGLRAAAWTHLGSTWSSPGVSAELLHHYLARDLTEVGRGDFEAEHEEAEMEVFRVPVDELRDAVLDGRVQDGPVAIAVLLAQARGLL
jgi:ADP-ribose pyrophosphatase